MNYITTNQRAYDDLAEEYAERRDHYRISDRIIAEPFIEYLKKHFKTPSVLELGPGSGLNLSYFEDEGFAVSAIDISQKIIDVAREATIRTNFITDDFMSHDFGNIKFDGIFAKAFIHLFPKNDAIIVLRKIYSLLSSGGIAFVATTVHDLPEEGFFIKSDYRKKIKRFRKRWVESELLEVLRSVDFAIISKSYHLEQNGKKWINLICSNRRN